MPDSHSLKGMKRWAHTTDVVTRSKQLSEGMRFSKARIAKEAYKVYKTHAINHAIKNMDRATLLRGPSTQGARNVRHRLEDRVPNLYWHRQGNLAHRAFYEDGSARQQSMSQARQQEKEQGLSARFSLVSDKFISNRQNQAGQTTREYARLANLTANWMQHPEASGAKVMQPGAIRQGRGDHAVLYSTILDDPNRRQTLANNLSSGLGSPSDYTPLGMAKAAPGVAYGEFVRSQQLRKANGRKETRRAPGWGSEKESSSFGMNRAHIIAEAIDNRMNNQDRSLNSHLRSSIRGHGYDVNRPAFVRQSVKNRRIQRNTQNKQEIAAMARRIGRGGSSDK